MVRIHANRVALQVESKLTVFYVFQFILVEIRPAPDARIYDVREALSPRHLKPSIKCSLYCDALRRVRTIRGYGRDKRVQLFALLFQFLDQAFDGAFREVLRLASLAMAHE